MKRADSLLIAVNIVRSCIGDRNVGIKGFEKVINELKLIPRYNFNNAPEYNESFDQFTIDLAKVIEKYVDIKEGD